MLGNCSFHYSPHFLKIKEPSTSLRHLDLLHFGNFPIGGNRTFLSETLDRACLTQVMHNPMHVYPEGKSHCL